MFDVFHLFLPSLEIITKHIPAVPELSGELLVSEAFCRGQRRLRLWRRGEIGTPRYAGAGAFPRSSSTSNPSASAKRAHVVSREFRVPRSRSEIVCEFTPLRSASSFLERPCLARSISSRSLASKCSLLRRGALGKVYQIKSTHINQFPHNMLKIVKFC